MKVLSFIQRGYWLHLALLIVIAGEFVAAKRAHLTDAEVDALFENGTPREKAYALHLIASRGIPRFTSEDVLPTLRSDEPLLRELMMTKSMLPFGNKRIRNREIARWADEPSRRRAFILLDYRIESFTSLNLTALECFLDAANQVP